MRLQWLKWISIHLTSTFERHCKYCFVCRTIFFILFFSFFDLITRKTLNQKKIDGYEEGMKRICSEYILNIQYVLWKENWWREANKVIIRYVLMLLVFIHSQFSGELIFVEKIALKIGKNELALLLIITNGNEKFINETFSTCFWCLYQTYML